MRFSILRRFSHLIHRRTKSEPLAVLAGSTQAPLDGLSRPHSLSHIDQLDFTPLDTVLSFSNGSDKLAAANKHILELERKIAEQKAIIDTLRFEAELRDEELQVFKRDFYTERSTVVNVKRKQKESEEQAMFRDRKLAQYERYFELMYEIGLGEALAAAPHQVMSTGGDDFFEALVNSIQAAASRPSSLWSKIIPAVVGPRTPGEYVSAINGTLKARKEARECAKKAKFWKKTARKDGTNAEVITPSSSNMSEVSQKSLSAERQQAVNELLAKLRSGEIPLRSRVARQAPEQQQESSLLPYLHSSSSRLSELTPPSLPSDQFLGNSIPRELPPLASQTFKEELIASYSSERFSLIKRTADVKRASVSSYPSSGSDSCPTLRANTIPPSEPSFLSKLENHIFRPEIPATEDSHARLGTIQEEPSADADATLVEENSQPSAAVSPKLSLLSRIPRRLSLSKSPPKTVSLPNKTRSRSILQPTISSSLKQTSPTKNTTPPSFKPVLPLRIVKKRDRS